MRRVAFKTLGCRLNQSETAQIAAQFERAGYEVVSDRSPCDVFVIHTCTITENAERTCMRLARSAKRRAPASLVVLAGCAVEVGRDRLLDATGADVLVNQDEKFRLPQILDGSEAPPDDAATPAPVPRFDTTRALVRVQDGCSFRCAYCIVPDARGAPRSRPLDELAAELRALAEQGYREVVLTGANLGCYRSGAANLISVIDVAEAIDGIRRVRLSSIEITTTERDVIDRMAAGGKLCPYLHLPLQSGDDGVLAAMGRRYDAARYRALVEHAVVRIPRLGLGTDIIVGFPGEDEAAFEQTLGLVRDLPFSNLHVFPYSRRPGTPAASLPEQVDEADKKRRASVLIALGDEKRRGFAESLVGQSVTVLIERVGEQATGWTGPYIPASLPAAGIRENDLVTFVPTRVADGTLV